MGTKGVMGKGVQRVYMVGVGEGQYTDFGYFALFLPNLFGGGQQGWEFWGGLIIPPPLCNSITCQLF